MSRGWRLVVVLALLTGSAGCGERTLDNALAEGHSPRLLAFTAATTTQPEEGAALVEAADLFALLTSEAMSGPIPAFAAAPAAADDGHPDPRPTTPQPPPAEQPPPPNSAPQAETNPEPEPEPEPTPTTQWTTPTTAAPAPVATAPPATQPRTVATQPPTTTTAAPPTTFAPVSVAGSFDPAGEAQFLALTNQTRRGVGLGNLAWDGSLTTYARHHAQVMASEASLHHSHIADLLGSWWLVGENVGVGPDVVAIQNALINSPAHYENIVHPEFTHMGIGVFVDSTGRTWTCHVFAA